jgi:hypothetical protein
VVFASVRRTEYDDRARRQVKKGGTILPCGKFGYKMIAEASPARHKIYLRKETRNAQRRTHIL